jgi:hypothetical protein
VGKIQRGIEKGGGKEGKRKGEGRKGEKTSKDERKTEQETVKVNRR